MLVDVISIFSLSKIRSLFLVDIEILIFLSRSFRVKIILVRYMSRYFVLK
jgi:hypothetical protein